MSRPSRHAAGVKVQLHLFLNSTLGAGYLCPQLRLPYRAPILIEQKAGRSP